MTTFPSVGLASMSLHGKCNPASTTGAIFPGLQNGDWAFFLVSFGAVDQQGLRRAVVMINSQVTAV